MAKFFIALISVLLVGVLSASPLSDNIMRIKRGPNKQRCTSLYSNYYQSSLNKTVLNKFLSDSKASQSSVAAMSSDRKYSSQKLVCWDYLHKTLTRMENELPFLTPCATLHHDQSVIFSKFEAFLEFLCSLNRKEFRSFTDADVFNRLTSSKIDVETCFENNRAQPEAQDEDYGAVQEVKPIGMDFCAFDIQVAMTCTKSIFDDTQDLAGFEAYTNFFSTQFTCDSYVSDNRAEESFYATLFDRKEGEEISFYGDFLTLIGDFFAN